MIVVLIAASIAQTPVPARKPPSAAPCHAVPALCMTSEQERMPLLADRPVSSDNKMNAYRFDARPCRIIGNFGCPKQARLRLFRLGEPIRETLSRTFLPR